MQCDYFDAGKCRSCTLMGLPYAAQLAAKDTRARQVLAPFVPRSAWHSPFPSVEAGFRNKAKLAIGGVPGALTLGILDGQRRGVDLRMCGLHEEPLRTALPVLAAYLDDLRLLPYDVRKGRGELKHVLATVNPDAELMVRLVLRSDRQLDRVREHLGELISALPSLRVGSVNFQPEHKAVLEGAVEIILTDAAVLPMRLPGALLHLRPGSFFQTNTAVAVGLYAQAREWVDQTAPEVVWDLHCGVGGFALHLLDTGRDVTGVEISPSAVHSARSALNQTQEAVAALGTCAEARFVVGDATAYAMSAPAHPDLVVVNPPRRGIGPELAHWLQESGVRDVLYSSCHPVSLARDLAQMPALRTRRARLFDMFPQSEHAEVLVHLQRR